MEGGVEGLDKVGAEINAAAPVGAWVANLRNVRFWVAPPYWVHNYTPSGVLRPPKRFLNFVACRHLDRHSRFRLSRFWLSRFCRDTVYYSTQWIENDVSVRLPNITSAFCGRPWSLTSVAGLGLWPPTSNVDRSCPFRGGRFMQICIEIGSFFFEYSVHNFVTDERTDGQTNIMRPSVRPSVRPV